MRKLPFRILPSQEVATVGNDAIGTLEIPRLYGLKVGEQAEIEALCEGQPDPLTLACKLACRVQQERGLEDLRFCFDAIVDPFLDQKLDADKIKLFHEIRILYAQEIAELNRQTGQSQKDRVTFTVSTLIKWRLVPEWTVEDTQDLSDGLYQALWHFAETEMSGEIPSESKPLAADDLKKPPGAN